jgi:hypothetical protein
MRISVISIDSPRFCCYAVYIGRRYHHASLRTTHHGFWENKGGIFHHEQSFYHFISSAFFKSTVILVPLDAIFERYSNWL